MTRVATISIVDDDLGVRTSLSSLIRSLGYEVRTYASGLEFLEESAMHEPDCLITDLQMPHMSGEELQRKLADAGRTIPIIAMTAFPTDASRARMLSAGAVAYLVKPVEVSMIAEYLAQTTRARARTS